jgi:ERF superfamily
MGTTSSHLGAGGAEALVMHSGSEATVAELAELAALNTALASAQGEFPAIPRSRTVTVKTRTGGKYTFSYAPLDAILAACRPVLSKYGLAVSQLLEDSSRGTSIRTELRHADGAVIGSSFPLPRVPESPQELGSLLTYLRRYAIVALLGIATEEDDDGNHAAGGVAEEMPVGDPQPTATPAPSGPRAAPVEATGEQLSEVRALIDRLAEIEPDTDWVARAREIAGVPGNMLTRAGAVIVIEKLRGELAQRQEHARG